MGQSGAQRTLVRDGGVGGAAPYEGRAPVLKAGRVGSGGSHPRERIRDLAGEGGGRARGVEGEAGGLVRGDRLEAVAL